MMAAAVMFIDPVLALMNIPPELYADAKSYVMIIVYGLIFMMAYNMLSNILRSLGDSKTPLYFLIVATLLNIVLALVFIINFGWGVPGSALALVVAQGFSGLLCIIYIAKKFPVLHVRLSDFKWDSRFAWEHIRTYPYGPADGSTVFSAWPWHDYYSGYLQSVWFRNHCCFYIRYAH